MIVPDHYCATLQAGLQISLGPNSSIQVSPCALEPFTFTVDQQVFNHPKLLIARQANQKNQILVGKCSTCKSKEESGLQCRNRSSANERYINDTLLYNQLGPKIITFKLDYTCNLACVTCGPDLSTKWRGINHTKGLSVQADEVILRKTIRSINLEQLETVHIFGGEPLLTRTHEIILEELLAYSKNITVWYDTNATAYPSDRTMELWDKFHLIRLKFSIDGVGKAFEYLRWPASWAQVEDNILRIKETIPVNHMLSVRPAIGFLNFHIIKDIVNWQRTHLMTNRLGDTTELEYPPVYGIYSASNMTQAMLDEIYTIYLPDDPIYDIVAPLTHDQQVLIEIRQTLDNLDQQRNMSWRTALPHLIPHLT
jgi:uncharacterized Fe-S radical SAM superfamily protein PflX